MTHYRCCPECLSCAEFAECVPGPCIRIPLMTFKREQKYHNSACTLALRELEFIIRGATFEWDSSSQCYLLQCAEVEVHFREQLWTMWGAWTTQKTFDTNDGDCCPDCLSCCKVSDVTFDVASQFIGNGINICCVQPCVSTSQGLMRLRFDWVLTGLLETKSLDPTLGGGCCGALVTDGPLSWGLPFYFEAFTPLTCDITKWFRCRSVDFYTGDLISSDTNGIGWAGGRIPGTTGGPKIDRICSGQYEHERPSCPTSLDCVNSAHGTLSTHYNVVSCRPTQAWPDTVDDPDAYQSLDFSFVCIAGPNTCPSKVCGDGKMVSGDPDCPNYSSACNQAPNPACDNATGLAAWAERTDKLESMFQQAVVASCVSECPPEGEP